MATDATVDTIDELVAEGHVLIDFWGPDCAPCIAMMPAVEALAERYAGRIRLIKVEAPEHRKICRDMRVAGLPTYITLRDGGEVERVTGNGASIADLEAAIERLLAGAPVTGLPVPEHLRWGGGGDDGRMDLQGKKVIALGERDSVPGEAIAEVARSAGADVIEVRTECFVWTASGAMDPENQGLIKRIAEEIGTADLVVILGAADAEAVEVAAETVREGDPAYVGPLAGVQLGLPVWHIFEDEVKAQADPAVYEQEVGFFELSFDTDTVKEAMRRARGEA